MPTTLMFYLQLPLVMVTAIIMVSIMTLLLPIQLAMIMIMCYLLQIYSVMELYIIHLTMVLKPYNLLHLVQIFTVQVQKMMVIPVVPLTVQQNQVMKQ